MPSLFSLTAALALFTTVAFADDLPSSFPHLYPGAPKGDISSKWQSYFQVTKPLPNVTFPLPRNFAGNLPVERENHPNNTFFFWGFESKNGSLTAQDSNEPWAIWLNGGPGSSSMIGMLTENGPIHIGSDYAASENKYSWNKLVDYFWIDQPVGVGFSTADAEGYIVDEDQMGRDFFGFLSNLVKVFPSLAKRPLYLTGESYAGVYIPYIMKTYYSLPSPPVKIAKIMIGDGSIGSWQATTLAPTVSVIETYPQLIGYDSEVFEYFKEQQHLCNYDINLTYPMTAPVPNLPVVEPRDRDLLAAAKARTFTKRGLAEELEARAESTSTSTTSIAKRHREERKEAWKRDLSARANGTIDEWYGCFLFDQILDYANNFTYPWTLGQSSDSPSHSVDYYNIPSALYPAAVEDTSVFMNSPQTRAALHAPTSKDYEESFSYVFGEGNDPSPEPMVFLSALATNMTAGGVSVILYSGNADLLLPHFGTEVTIQNTTFGGIQGFTRPPSTPWTDDDGSFAGIVHQERNWTYALFTDAGHLVPAQKPAVAYTFIREFLVGSNQTGLVVSSSATASVIGGEDLSLAGVIPGAPEIYVGASKTESTYLFPQPTRDAWAQFRAEAASSPVLKNTSSNSGAMVMAPLAFGIVATMVTILSSL